MAAGVVGLLAPGVAAAHPQTTLDPKTSAAEEITDLWWFMLITSTVVVMIVVTLTLLAVLRRRGRADAAARFLGRQGLVSLGGLVVPIAILSVLFALTLETLQETAPAHVHPELTIEVEGEQWFWNVRYPEAGAITANEIHVPTRTPVEIRVRTKDVLHSFWAPQLNRKIDLLPGRPNRLTFVVNEPGRYRGQCAEYCGLQHANMAFTVVAQEPAEFEAWLANEADPAREPPPAVFMDSGCAACHTIRGSEAQGKVGPDLTHFAGREFLAARTLENTRGDLGGWILDPQGVKPGTRMPGTELDGEELDQLLDYLESLR